MEKLSFGDNSGERSQSSLIVELVAVVCVLSTAFFSSIGHSEHLEMRPAVFGDAGRELLESFSIPEQASFDRATVRCGGKLRSSGRFEVVLCATSVSEEGSARRLSNNVASAARRLKLQPARVNGLRKAVWFVFSMDVERRADGDAVTIYHNDGASENALGKAYIAPQKYRFHHWDKHRSCDEVTGLGRGVIAIASVDVTELGKASAVSLNYNPADEECAAAIKAAIIKSDYIPARKAGVPIAAKHDEVFFSIKRYWMTQSAWP